LIKLRIRGDNMNLGKMLEDVCDRYGGNICFIHEGRELTYSELNRTVNSLGNRLRTLGLQKGDNVAIMLPNVPEFVISYFAIQKIGATAVTLNIVSTPHELSYFLRNSDSKALITNSSSVERFDEVREELPLCAHLIVTAGPDAPSSFKEAVEAGPFELEMPEIEGDDPAAIIYTAGHTGTHGIVLTHNNLLTQIDIPRIVWGCYEDDRVLCIIPFFHAFGAMANILSPVKLGNVMVMIDEFSIDSVFKITEKQRITYITAVPKLLLDMLSHEGADKYDLSSLRVCPSGGAPMPSEYIPKFQEKFHVKVLEGYGLTEASPGCVLSRFDMEQKIGSVGVAIDGVEVKVLDDEGIEAQTGKSGEVVVRGANVMKGYYKDEKETARVIKKRLASHR
jgi:Acyl-CoA synthetases (AMP-forming)/AMP-acid ligases II